MSDNNTGGVPRALADDTVAVLTPYDESAAQSSKLLAAVIASMPEWEPKHRETEQFVRRYSTFSTDVIANVIAAVEANPEMAVPQWFNVGRSRAGLQFLTAYRPFVDQTDEFHVNVRFTYFSIKARLIREALRMYAIAKGIGLDQSSAGVAAHAEVIKRDLRRPRIKKTKKEGTPTPDKQKPN